MVVAVLAVVAVGAGIGLAASRDGAEAAGGGCSGDAPLRISASAPVAAVLADHADDFDEWVEGRAGMPCTTTEVTTASPQEFSAAVGRALDGDTESAPTTWVPDSSLWRSVLARDPRVADVLPRTYPVVAASPVVFAAPRPMAEALGWPERQPSWGELSALAADPAGWSAKQHPEWGRMRLEWPNPLTSTAGLGSTVAVYRDLAIGAEATDELRRRLVTAHNAVSGSTGDLGGALGALRESGATAPEALKDLPVVPATEQEVVAFNARKPAVEVAAIYPTEGWVVSEVPVLGLEGDWVTPEQRQASEAFADYVVRGDAQAALQAAGWRAARLDSGVTADAGVVATQPRYTPAQPSQDVLARTLQNWTALDRRGSLLVVLDTSGSMKEEVGTTGKSRLDVAKESILASLPFFADEASVGLWTFSRSERGSDHVQVVPLGPLNRKVGQGTARDSIASSVPRITAANDTALYETTLAAVDAVRSSWQPGPNTVVLISDGKNEDPGSPDLDTTLARLVDGADPARPVEVVTIALGSGADAKALRNISRVTKGKAYSAGRPEDLQSVFLTALTG
ncbi:substrate-binding and VWA domain-containing protein [Fodinibacter luteus]|uniref:Substrate-binding and VWA domain-containing protein n=1 Tax=Fodinibacter luteus TaxID=552064 RepID=A0ABP8KQ77_9MICO